MHAVRLRTSDLPFGAVLGPQTNTTLFRGDTGLLVDLDETSTEGLVPLRDLAIGLPNIFVLPRLGLGVPGPGTKALGVGELLGSLLEEVVGALDSRVEGGQEAIAEAEVSVDGSTVFRLGTGDGDALRGVGSRWHGEVADGLLGIGSRGGHDGGFRGRVALLGKDGTVESRGAASGLLRNSLPDVEPL